NGDGIADFAFATGSGIEATVRIISGATGSDLVSPTTVLGGFTGGAFLAAGDVNGDGSAELAVSADVGGGPRVQLFEVQGGTLVDVLDFIAFGTPDFRGGSRVAMADVNNDGFADLIVGAGIGGGPRVSIYNGASLLSGNPTRLVPDFFAFSSTLRSGVYVTAADFNGDGYADIAYSTGDTGGPRIRVVSGLELMQNPGSDVSSLPAMADFFALDPSDRNGIRVVARDLNGDGDAELIVGSGAIEDPSLRVIPLSQMNTPTNPLQNPFGDIDTIDGLYVG
ncbi:MAG TPA: VCBS repeat-containing protein, partial [Urbifossiella sp.]